MIKHLKLAQDFEESIDKINEIVDFINKEHMGKAGIGDIKCMESYGKGLRDAVYKTEALRDLLLGAFVAETGALPSECILIETMDGDKRITRAVLQKDA